MTIKLLSNGRIITTIIHSIHWLKTFCSYIYYLPTQTDSHIYIKNTLNSCCDSRPEDFVKSRFEKLTGNKLCQIPFFKNLICCTPEILLKQTPSRVFFLWILQNILVFLWNTCARMHLCFSLLSVPLYITSDWSDSFKGN